MPAASGTRIRDDRSQRQKKLQPQKTKATNTPTTGPTPWSPTTPTPPPPSTLLRYRPFASPRSARTERGVLTFPPYTPALLPHWRFATVSLARTSSATLLRVFEHYERVDDWVGADMARKFLQMGVTRARRYANYKGGRKYVNAGDRGGEVWGKRVVDGRVVEREGMKMGEEERKEVEEKLAAGRVFGEVLEEVRGRVWYVEGRARYWEEVRRLEGEGWWVDGDGVVRKGDVDASLKRGGGGQKREAVEEPADIKAAEDTAKRRRTRSTDAAGATRRTKQ